MTIGKYTHIDAEEEQRLRTEHDYQEQDLSLLNHGRAMVKAGEGFIEQAAQSALAHSGKGPSA